MPDLARSSHEDQPQGGARPEPIAGRIPAVVLVFAILFLLLAATIGLRVAIWLPMFRH